MNLKFIGVYTWYYGVRSIKRGPSYIISSILYPLVFLFLITVFSAGKYIDYAVIGGFISIISMNAIYSGSDWAFHRLQLKIQDLFVATGIGPVDYMFAMALSYFASSLPGIAVYAVIGILLGLFTPLIAAVFIVLLFAVLFGTMAISFTIFGFIKHVRNIWGVAGIASILLTVLPPTFYPYTILPKPVLYVFMLSPITEVAMLSQSLFGLVPFAFYAIPVLMLEMVVYLVIAKYLVHWRES
ncbi:ABC-2 type transporter [mine drainage metagenome]|uniref:ABC-2 type transporter n=1 Tax=mine drainage metagenome TaxID=410659 RepID=T0ZNM9_9ZZZZ